MPEEKRMAESLLQEALRCTDGIQCAVCMGPKEHGRAFCGRCYFRLPQALRKGLYRTPSEGYATAWDEARDWLRINI